ncbi:MAG: protease HtpX, partial [Methylococcales bacterium]
MRILLFLLTNLAILVVVSVVFNVLGISGILDSQGINLNLNALLVMSAVIGMTGSFISLMLSKFLAKRAMGVQIIGE